MRAWRGRSRSAPGVVALGLVLALLSACDRPPAVPVEYPFVLQSGHRLQGEFGIREDAWYALQLVYRFDNDAGRELARWRAGWGRMGVDATLSVSVRDQADGRVVLATTVRRPALSSWNSTGLWSEVVRLRLPPGAYDFDVRVDAAEPSLRGQRVEFEVRRAYVGK